MHYTNPRLLPASLRVAQPCRYCFYSVVEKQVFRPTGYTPLSNFYKIRLEERVPGPHPHTKFHLSGLKNVGLQPQISQKIAIFAINLPIWENFGGPQKMLNIGAQLQTFLYAMTP